MTPDEPRSDDQSVKSLTVRLVPEDFAALQRITQRRYPRDNNRFSQVIRDLIREDDERGRKGK